MNKHKKARFWFLHPCTCEWVKITLKPGQSLSWHHFQTTDEGFSEKSIELRYLCNWNPPVVKAEEFNRSRDCDGVMHNGFEVFSLIDELSAEDRPIEFWNRKTNTLDVERWIRVPNWKKLREYQRDFTAEAAGY